LVAQLAGTDLCRVRNFYDRQRLCLRIVGGCRCDATWSTSAGRQSNKLHLALQAGTENGYHRDRAEDRGQLTALNDGYVLVRCCWRRESDSRGIWRRLHRLWTLPTGGADTSWCCGHQNSIAPPAFVDNTIVIFKRPRCSSRAAFGLQVFVWRLKNGGRWKPARRCG